jgi:hypothetical protein
MKYDDAVADALRTAWLAANRICSKRLTNSNLLSLLIRSLIASPRRMSLGMISSEATV